MKRKLLIPLLTPIALSPTIAMVGCNKGLIQINVDIDASEIHREPSLISEPFSIEIGTPYRFNVDISDDTTYIQTSEYISFVLDKKVGDISQHSEALFEVNSIVVDNQTLEFDPDAEFEPTKPNTYMVYQGVDFMFAGGMLSKNLTDTSIVTIDLTFTATDPDGDVYFYFMNSFGG